MVRIAAIFFMFPQSLYVIRAVAGKASLPILVLLETVTVLRLRQSENASYPIEVTLEGMVTLVRLLHPRNALSPIEITLEGMVMLVRLSHHENALSPIEVMLEGMIMLVRLLHL